MCRRRLLLIIGGRENGKLPMKEVEVYDFVDKKMLIGFPKLFFPIRNALVEVVGLSTVYVLRHCEENMPVVEYNYI